MKILATFKGHVVKFNDHSELSEVSMTLLSTGETKLAVARTSLLSAHNIGQDDHFEVNIVQRPDGKEEAQIKKSIPQQPDTFEI